MAVKVALSPSCKIVALFASAHIARFVLCLLKLASSAAGSARFVTQSRCDSQTSRYTSMLLTALLF